MRTIEEMIEVMSAAAQGKPIIRSLKNTDDWHDCVSGEWNWETYNYKVKLVSKVGWINIYSGNRCCTNIYDDLATAKREANHGVLATINVHWME